jgi:hypothetical protein
MFKDEVVFLGHVVSKDGIKPDPTNIAIIVQWPRPSSSKAVKQFVTTGSYYMRFVRDFAKIARPLINLTKKDVEFKWDAQAFNQLKECLVGPDVMGYSLNDAGRFMLDVNAAGVGICVVLSENAPSLSQAERLNKAETNYCITKKKLLEVIYFICNISDNTFSEGSLLSKQITKRLFGCSV